MDLLKFYIDGAWVAPLSDDSVKLINPATEQQTGIVASASAADVDRAVSAAQRAFVGYSMTSPAARAALLQEILKLFEQRHEEIATAISLDMGAPITLSRERQATIGATHLRNFIQILETYEFEARHGRSRVFREPIGVCALITPWNWPLNQIVLKVAPALAAGCTVVLKPSEAAPRCAMILADIIDKAGVPKGVFNLVNGIGAVAGAALSSHPLVDMISFTGSTRAGIAIAKAAADSVKRVSQELGGKSPNILLPDADFERAVTLGVQSCISNSGQSCNAPTRMLVPADRLVQAEEIARKVTEAWKVGNPADPETMIGPVVNGSQFERIQNLIHAGIAEGAKLVAGGPGRPDGLVSGFYVRPTVFSGVTPEMTIAKEEIFGPVLSIMAYTDVAEAVRIANATEYGLQGFVQSANLETAQAVARQLRAGQVVINYAPPDRMLPFGGYKQSGNGREGGILGMEEFTEVKAVVGYDAA